MLDVIFLAVFFLFPCLVLFILKRFNFPFLRVDIPQIVIAALFVYSYFGLLILYFGWDKYRLSIGVNDKGIVLLLLLFSIAAISLFISGVLVARQRFSFLMELHNKGFRYSGKEVALLALLLIFVIYVLNIYISKLSSVALFVAINEGAGASSEMARSNMGNNFAGKYHRYAFVMRDLANIVTFALFSAWLVYRKFYVFILLALSVVVTMFSSILAVEKGPFLWLLIGMFLTYCLTSRNGKLPLRLMAVSFLILVAVAMSFYIFFMGSNPGFEALGSVFSRILTGQLAPAYFYVEYFSSESEFLLGASFPNPAGILPFVPVSLTKDIMVWKFPHEAATGVVGSAPTVFWGELYANFGIVGVLTVPFTIGFLVVLVSILLSQIPSSPSKIALVVWAMIHYASLATTGISAFIIDVKFFAVGAIVLSVFLLSRVSASSLFLKKVG